MHLPKISWGKRGSIILLVLLFGGAVLIVCVRSMRAVSGEATTDAGR